MHDPKEGPGGAGTLVLKPAGAGVGNTEREHPPGPSRIRNLGHRWGKILTELRRRRVIRLVVGYVALALVGIEGASNVLEPLGFDPSVMRFIVLLAIAGFPAAVTLAWIFDINAEGVVRTPAAGAPAEPSVPVVPFPRTNIAVLPFTELSDSSTDRYFSDGVTDDIISTLSRIPGLRVTSRTSTLAYRTATKAIAAIAEELQVGSVLEGTVRRADGRVRIVARLVDPATDEQVWSATYDRDLEDILGIQTEVATEISSALTVELGQATVVGDLGAAPSTDRRAYDAYLKGRFQWNQRTERGLLTSLAHLEQAVEADPGFAAAHAALADSWIALGLYSAVPPTEAMPQARKAAERALDLDPHNGEALSALACVQALFDWDWAQAESTFREAIEASPSYATARQWFALHLLAPQGRFLEAEEQLRIARELDPASAPIRASQAFLAALGERCDEAVSLGRGLVGADPGFALGHLLLGQALAHCGRFDEAIQSLRTAASMRGLTPDTRAVLAHALADADRVEEAQAIRRDLQSDSAHGYLSPARLAQLYAALGDDDAALACLEEAARVRAVDLVWIGVTPQLQRLRSTPRFSSVVRQMGL